MINWYAVIANGAWVVGLGFGLSVASYIYWDAGMKGKKFFESLREPHYQILFCISGFIFCSGMAAVSTSIIKQVLWMLIYIILIAIIILNGRKARI